LELAFVDKTPSGLMVEIPSTAQAACNLLVYHFPVMEPFYKSERCFRRYEPAIKYAVDKFPAEISFRPQGGRTVATEKARCSDAITSWLKNRWETNTPLDPEKVGELVVYEFGDGFVRIASKHTRGLAMDKLRPISDLTITHVTPEQIQPHLNVSELSDITNVAELIEALDSGKSSNPVSIPFSDENLKKVINAISGRLNVAYYIKDDKINIF
jgi:hypothetical protein